MQNDNVFTTIVFGGIDFPEELPALTSLREKVEQ
jgi:hypothetical protein